MPDQPGWVNVVYYGAGILISAAYLVAFGISTARSRAQVRDSTDTAYQRAVASRWAVWLTNANSVAYVAVLAVVGFMLVMTDEGWKGAWLPLLLLALLVPLRHVARRQNRLYAKLFLGVELAEHKPQA